MTETIPFLPTTNDERKHRKPANIYYTMPYYHQVFCCYIFTGSFACAWFTDYVSRTTEIFVWVAFAITCLLVILANPFICTERKKVDEEGHTVTVRYPLIGFKRCEVALDLEGIKRGLYDSEDGNTDVRLHDGYRYGRALVRI
ncbi:hypothetical protein ASPWEDRAFT_168208 [Aspergillus wentii DTO 134E9]|uniref:Uncharacterized protein n=1 Tax=Aspergillus wentii DTO 134E9 TaxID=1073089 RepID=A0A1L9RTL0_ASPWE|nr:uncharacterized protein ASPWEDRAFT_168208 [Aspergillus wentii DTO 134E9]KAI9933933.1 hypothetical protein MW887_005005 [Aspergillus wentii]OJJ38291.1 hypothetical protein ASPWEDRAFT_168208 [Aspergillus wentii DTO 134E9]